MGIESLSEEHMMEIDTSVAKSKTTEILDEDTHKRLVDYLMCRIKAQTTNRQVRINRMARIDQTLSTWQELTPEDSIRDLREEQTGRMQGIPMNLPVAKAHIDDAVSFYSELFAPIGGNYYADPGKRQKTPAVKALANKMNQDSKSNSYYSSVTSALYAIHKYNFGGFTVNWVPESDENSAGNVVSAIDMYNFFYDESITDVHRLAQDGEWAAIAEIKNRLWFYRQHNKEPFMNLDKVFSNESKHNYPRGYGKASFYRYPPKQTNIRDDGNDTRTTQDSKKGQNIDWTSWGLGDEETFVETNGYEVIRMYCWILESQFGLTDPENPEADDLKLYLFTIACGDTIIRMEKIEGAIEIPVYVARLDQDDLREAARSIAEHLRPFQRMASFLLNTHVDGIRSNIWGINIYDPTAVDATTLNNGSTSANLPLKEPGRDVRTVFAKANNDPGTRQNMADAATLLDMMKLFYPNQALPAQIASMDRAVSNQVSAVMQGATRKTHMFARVLDAVLFLPVRMAQYRNIAQFDPDKGQLSGINNEEVAELLNSGLGQLTREAAAEQIRSLIFALIQNPDAAQGIDMKGLWALYSMLLNIGTDLGEFLLQPTLTNQETTPVNAEAVPTEQSAAIPGGSAPPGFAG